ncbi:hypothetical protein FKP32DRAFT_1560438 [Trametes sanguinea]|nr:hypothetical protein FKP32DRAFT_1560438 [Trametes sanguinea]
MISTYATALITLLCLVFVGLGSYILRTYRTPRRRLTFAYAATTALKQHRTTNLELFVPLPKDYATNIPTILRDFANLPHSRTRPVRLDIIPLPARPVPIRPSPARSPSPGPPPAPVTPPLIDCPPSSKEGNASAEPVLRALAEDPRHTGQDSGKASRPVKVPNIDHHDGSADLLLFRQTGNHAASVGAIETPYFELQGTREIVNPPPFVSDDDVQLGDVFYYRRLEDSERFQMWIWSLDPITGTYWKRVRIGYKREDGRRLTLTEKKRIPSWIGQRWYFRRGMESA